MVFHVVLSLPHKSLHYSGYLVGLRIHITELEFSRLHTWCVYHADGSVCRLNEELVISFHTKEVVEIFALNALVCMMALAFYLGYHVDSTFLLSL